MVYTEGGRAQSKRKGLDFAYAPIHFAYQA